MTSVIRPEGRCNAAFFADKRVWMTVDDTNAMVEFGTSSIKTVDVEGISEDSSISSLASSPLGNDYTIAYENCEIFRKSHGSQGFELVTRTELSVTKIAYSDNGKHL